MQVSVCCQCNMRKLCVFTGTNDSTKNVLPFSRLDYSLLCKASLTAIASLFGDFSIHVFTLHYSRWLTVALFSAYVKHVFWKLWLSISFRLDQICVGVLKCCTNYLLLNFIFIVVTSFALSSLQAFHFHSCVSTFTLSYVISLLNVSLCPQISSLSLLLQSSLLPSSGAVAFAFEGLVMLSLVELNSLHPKVLSSSASPWEQWDILSAEGHGSEGSEDK